MKIKNTDIRNIIGKRIRIKAVSNIEDNFLVGLKGNVTNPFGCFGADSIIGVFLEPNVKVTNDFCNLTLEDEIEFIEAD